MHAHISSAHACFKREAIYPHIPFSSRYKSTTTILHPARPVGGDRWLPTEPYGRLVGYAVAQLGTASRDWHWHMSQACGDAYSRTLERWHGWLATFEFLGTYYSLSKGVVC